jgi:chondroitin AC lyase
MNPMRLLFCQFIFILLTLQITGFAQSQNEALNLIDERLNQWVIQELPAPDGQPMEWIQSQLENGMWPDINYNDKAPTNWVPRLHWQRLRELARLINRDELSDIEINRIKEAINRGIHYWVETPPVCSNPWYNAMGLPQEMGYTLLLMGNRIEDSLRDRVVALMDVPPVKERLGVQGGVYYYSLNNIATGQNLVWLASIHLMMGVIMEKPEWVAHVSQRLSEVIEMTTAEGIQPDYSFHQHGPQFYSGGYGMSFTESVSNLIAILHGTSFALSSEKEDLMVRFILEGQRWLTYKQQFDYHSMGREITRMGKNALPLARVANRLADVGVEPATKLKELAASIERNQILPSISGAKLFPHSEVLLYHYPDAYFSLHTTSWRVRGGESGNGENESGFLLAQGSYFFLKSGNEYDALFPVMDWKRLPGSLAPLNFEMPEFTWGLKSVGHTGFSGGVSDRNTALWGFDYDCLGVTARRAWFCFPNGLIHLVGAVSSTDSEPLIQTINQCRAAGDLRLGTLNESQFVAESIDSIETLSWVSQDGLGYVFPEARPVRCRRIQQEGSWSLINKSLSADMLAEEVFSLWFTLRPEDRKGYYYAIVNNALFDASHASDAIKSFEILRNDSEIQALWDHAQSTLWAVCYKPGLITLPTGQTLYISYPIALALNQTEDGCKIWASDPTHSIDQVNLIIDGQYKGVKCRYRSELGQTYILIDFPSDRFNVGQTVGPLNYQRMD